jgi:hypothetical protein
MFSVGFALRLYNKDPWLADRIIENLLRRQSKMIEKTKRTDIAVMKK